MLKNLKLTTILFFTLLICSCNTQIITPNTTNSDSNKLSEVSIKLLQQTSWRLQEIRVSGSDSKEIPQEIVIKMDIKNETFEGINICNSYYGNLVFTKNTEDSNSLKLEGTTTELLACQEGSDFGTQYIQALDNVYAFELENDTLRLFYGKNDILIFKRDN